MHTGSDISKANSLLKPVHGEWLVLAVQPHRELFALQNLIRQGFHVYCPMIVKHIRHARRAYDAPRPLFPGYIFVEQNKSSRWRAILGTTGVKTVVMCGERPSLLPQGLVESIKAREAGGVIHKPETPFQIGQQVTVQSGAFEGLIGQIVELRENQRILLLLDLLNRQTRVHVSAKQLA
jgi:transcriptional antiterminator RfaH